MQRRESAPGLLDPGPQINDDDHRIRLQGSFVPNAAETVVRWLAVFAAVAVLSLVGCSRTFYRLRADRDAYELIERTSCDTREPCGDYSIAVPPSSRLFDPFDPDCEPMPPDDPAAHCYLQRVLGLRGSRHWMDNGQTPFVESSAWRAMLPVNEKGQLVLDADQSMRLALLHSRDYQDELEDLYLSALDVSLERFQFDTQFFGGYTVDYLADGPDRNGDGQSSSDFLVSTFPTGSRGIRMDKMFATGAELVVGLANSFMWQFSGPDTHSALTLVDFTLVQPLLRGAGRAVVLEELTQTQRDLLYNVRQMERFRRAFYVDVISGRTSGIGPGRSLRVLDGVISSVGGVGGYLGLLQRRQTIRNQEANIASLRTSLAQLEAFFEAGRIDFFQVESVRQQLYQRQSGLLELKTAYETELDRFKIDIGLPPQLEAVIEDPMLDQFNLMDTKIVPVRNQLADLQESVGDVIIELLPHTRRWEENSVTLATSAALAAVMSVGPSGLSTLGAAAGTMSTRPPLPEVEWTDELARGLQQLRDTLPQLERIRQQVLKTNVPRAEADIKRLSEALPERRRELMRIQRKLAEELAQSRQDDEGHRVAQNYRSPLAKDIERLEGMPAELNAMLPQVVDRFRGHEAIIQQISADLDELLATGASLPPGDLLRQLRSKISGPLPDELTDLSVDVLELTLIQARARTESVSLLPIEIASSIAIDIARENRRDWMNARANLVDSWRDIKVVADTLESDLDIVFEGDIRNKGDNPLRLRSTAGRLRVAAQFDAPLTRLAERNAYRETLIEYQRARRDYMRYEDAVAGVLRDIIRNIELTQVNFELRRAAVHVAIARVEVTQLRLQEPPKPKETKQFGNTTARDLLDALSELLRVQNEFLDVWLTYQVLRRTLDLDMGTMQLDPEGIWVDPGAIRIPGSDNDVPEELELLPPGSLLLPPATDGTATERPRRVRLAEFFNDREAGE